MHVTRRTFLGWTTAAGAVAMTFWIETNRALGRGTPECFLPTPDEPQRFVPDEPRIRTRFSAAELAGPGKTVELQRFRDAIGLVRSLPSNDVIGWTRQVAQHCLSCASENRSNIHYDWQFLVWHRAYLYFLERILRTLSHNDDLRLVYWNWESKDSRTLPEIYAPPGQPLYWPNRGLTGPSWPLSDEDVDVQPLLGIASADTFFGTSVQREPVPAAFSGPHANVHNAFDPGDMADLQFSPRDPVFFAHHGNIDRVWSSWVHAGHVSPDFGDAKVYFYDEQRQWRYVLMNDLRDESKLGYQYSSLIQPTVPIDRLRSFAFGKDDTRFTLSSEDASALPSRPGPLYLIIHNIQNLDRLPADRLRYGIFSGYPPVGVETASIQGYLGKIARVRSGDHEHVGPLSAALNVSGKLGTLAGEIGQALELTVAPLDESGKTTGPAIPLVADSISLIG